MKNNIDVKNITEERFTGTYSGVEIEVMPGEVRHLPSDAARHIGLQLATQIFKGQDRKNLKTVKGIPQILDLILSSETVIEEPVKTPTLKESIAQHEKEFSEYLNNKKKEEILKRTNALDIEL